MALLVIVVQLCVAYAWTSWRRRIRREDWLREYNAALDTIEPECDCPDRLCGMDTDQLRDIEERASRNARRTVQFDTAHIRSDQYKTVH